MKSLHLGGEYVGRMITGILFFLVLCFFSQQAVDTSQSSGNESRTDQILTQAQFFIPSNLEIPSEAQEANSYSFHFVEDFIQDLKLKGIMYLAVSTHYQYRHVANQCLLDEGRHLFVKYHNLRI